MAILSIMPKTSRNDDSTSLQSKINLVNDYIHPSLRRVYHEVVRTLTKDFDKFLHHAKTGDIPYYQDAKKALDGLHYRKGLEVLSTRYNKNYEYLQQRFSYPFICYQGLEYYQHEYWAVTIPPSSTSPTVEPASTSTNSSDMVVRSENPHNLEFWISNIPYNHDSSTNSSKNNGNDMVDERKENDGSCCYCTYTNLYRTTLERQYSSYSMSSSGLQALILACFDYACKFMEMDQLKHAIDGMEDLGLDEMAIFSIGQYLEEYLDIVDRFLERSTTTSVAIIVPGQVRNQAIKYRETVCDMLRPPIQHHGRQQQQQCYPWRDEISGFDVFSPPSPQQPLDVFSSSTVRYERPVVDKTTPVHPSHHLSLNWHLSRLKENILQGLP